MRTDPTLLIFLAAGVAVVWYLFKGQSASGTTSPTATPTIAAYNTLDQIASRVRSAADNGYAILTAAQWDSLVAQYSTVPAPAVFPASQQMNFYVYWATVRPYLQQHYGLTGMSAPWWQA